MPPEAKRPKFLSRVTSFFSKKGHGGNSTSAPNTSIDPLIPQDPSAHSLPQDPISQPLNHPATNETNPVKYLHFKAGATRLAASTSTSIAREPLSGSLTRPANTSRREITTPLTPQDRQLLSSHSPQAPSEAILSSVSLIEDAPASQSILNGAHHFQMGDFVHVNMVNEELNQYNSVNIGA